MLNNADGSSQLVELSPGSLELLNLLDLVYHTFPRRVMQFLLGKAEVSWTSLLDHLNLSLEILFLRAELAGVVQGVLQDGTIHVHHHVFTDLLNVLVNCIAEVGVVAKGFLHLLVEVDE